MNENLLLEDVFKRSGIPTYTFVHPVEYETLLVALRTPGRGVVIEGPSGIGKTTAVVNALRSLDIHDATSLSARKADDRDLIKALPTIKDAGVVIIDDFHRLDLATKAMLADYMKTLADEESREIKLVVVGINRAGDTLVSLAPDLNNRIDTLRFEANPAVRVEQLVRLGEEALNIGINIRDEVVAAAAGSFYIAQMLCHETCLVASILERPTEHVDITISYETVLERVNRDLSRTFLPVATKFASGTKLRREGRAPYLHLLKWLAESDDWVIDIDRELAKHPELKGSVGQVVDKGYLGKLLDDNEDLRGVFHLSENEVLGIEDPQFVFFIRNMLWNKFADRLGFLNITFESRYDIALSFAGADRPIAEELFELLSEMEFEVFYDKNEQARILAEDVEEYLGPIYKSEARFVVALLGPDYPKRIWAKFESDQFKERFGQGAVIPVWFSTAPPGLFDESTRVGGYEFDMDKDLEKQIAQFAELIRQKVAHARAEKH